MSDRQFRQILEQMNNHVKRNLSVLNAVREELLDDEDLLTFIEAQDGNSGNNCLLVLIDRRLMVAQKRRRGQFELESIPFEELLFGGYRRTRMFGRIDVWQGQVQRHFNSTDKEMMEAFGKHFVERFDSWYKRSNHFEEIGSDVSQARHNRDGATPWLVELERLVELWHSGGLNDAEFQLAKRKLLS